MKAKIKSTIKTLFNVYIDWVRNREFEQQPTARHNERPVELSFVFKKLSEIYPQKVLDVGTGTTALPSLIQTCGCVVSASDNIRDYWPEGMSNWHFHIIDDDITHTKIKSKFDFISCISVLEHIENHQEAFRNLINILEPDGHLILTFPYTESKYVRNVYEDPKASYGKDLAYICQSYSRIELSEWLKENNATIIEQEYWQFWDGDCWTFGNKKIPPKKVNVSEKHQITCLHIKRMLEIG